MMKLISVLLVRVGDWMQHGRLADWCAVDYLDRAGIDFTACGRRFDRSVDRSPTNISKPQVGVSTHHGRLDAEALHDVRPDVLVHVEHPHLLLPTGRGQQPLWLKD
jgi:hypothetical protein